MDPLRRAYSHWYQDGLGELVQAFIFFMLGLYYLLVWRLPAGSPQAAFFPILLPFVIIIVAVVGRWLLGCLKERITYPRAGYVSYRRDSLSRKVIARVAIGVTLGVAIQLASIFLLDWGVDWVVFVMGIGFGLIYLYSGWRTGVWRLIVLGIIGILAGSLLAFSGWPDAAALAAFFFTFALLVFIIGIVVLSSFIQRNPLMVEEVNEPGWDPGEEVAEDGK